MALNEGGKSINHIFMNVFLAVSSFIWYFLAFTALRNLIENANISSFDVAIIWALNFCGASASAISSTKIASLLKRRILLMYIWLFFGFLTSLTPIFMDITLLKLSIIALLYGVSFGIGMPTCMEYFAEATTIENRGHYGGISFFATAIGVFLLSILSTGNLLVEVLISAVWRGLGLLILFFVKPIERKTLERGKPPSYISIINTQGFLFYIIPWWMFCLVNYTSIPIMTEFFGEEFVRFSSIVESILMSIFSLITGHFIDAIGRKRVAVVGLIILGIAYSILGLFPGLMLGWYLYIIADGIAWGIFHLIFIIVLWGDLAQDAPSGNFYALGGLPFLLSYFLQVVIGSYISETISVYAIFSLASFFLFLAVIPLMFAPETLPEKAIKERELKSYIEKAKKVREKFT